MAELDLYGDLELPAAAEPVAEPAAPKALVRNLVWRRPEVEVVDLEAEAGRVRLVGMAPTPLRSQRQVERRWRSCVH